MPIYEYRCGKCGEQIEEIRSINDIECNVPFCKKCSCAMNLMISAPCNNWISGYPYFDKILEKEISDPAHRKKELKKLGYEERG